MKINDKNLVTEHNKITKEILALLKQNHYTLHEPLIILNPYKTAPLTALISFATPKEGYCSVKVHGKDVDTDISYNFKEITTTHLLPIYGLFPDYDNTVSVEFMDEVISYTIKTEPLPKNMSSIQVVTKSNTKELTFITDNYTRAFDKNGDIRWYLSENIVISKDSPVRFLKNGNIAVMNNKLLHHHCYVSGILELSLLGKIENEYIINGANHEILELNTGDFLVICDKDDFSTEDYIAIIDRKTGLINSDYDFKEILNITPEADITYQSSFYAYKKLLNKNTPDMQILAEVKLKYMFDWLHINSVYYNEDENYIIVSCRIKDCVIKLNSITSEIIWIFTNSDIDWCDDFRDKILKPTNFDNTHYCYGQHSARITPCGDLIIFDNGNFKSKDFSTATPPNENYSRGVAYSIDEQNLTITQTFSFGENLDEKIYACYQGNIEYLNPNHYLINFGGIIFDNEGNFYDAPVVMSDESILTKTVICEVLDNAEISRYIIDNVHTYRATRNNIYSNSSYISLNDNAQILGEARVTATIELNMSLVEMENAPPLNYTINDISDHGERLVFDITFNNCDEDSARYIVFAYLDNYLIFEFNENIVGINKCTLDCLDSNYRVGLFCYDSPNSFAWI